jgi:hypothetical protein
MTGQDYKPLVVEGNSWSTVGWSWGNAWTDYYFIEGDTSINSVGYKKVYKTPDSLLQSDLTYWGGMREDTISREVYYYSNWAGEKRIYKFSLEVNDTISVWSLECGPYIAMVEAKDSIVDLFGNVRERMKVGYYGAGWVYDEYWIEGIGSTLGLLSAGNFMCIADLNFELLCYRHNDDLYYMNPLYDTCYITMVSIAEREPYNSLIKISPNPLVSQSKVHIPEYVKVQRIYITDSFGRLIKELDVNELTIVKDHFPAGIYILSLKTAGGDLYHSRFVVQ